MRARTSINLKPRSSCVLEDFRGVDFSSSPLRIASNRAAESTNLINEYGVNHKRRGWREVLALPNQNNKRPKINGVYHYTHGTYDVLLVHVGTKFYTFDWSNDFEFGTGTDTEVLTIEDTRSQFFAQKGKVYIIGAGNFLVYGGFVETENNVTSTVYSLKKVVDTEVFVPTTTIYIENDSVTDGRQQKSLDKPNLLTKRRKNTLVGCALPTVGEGQTASVTWTLDATPVSGTVSVKVDSVEQLTSNYNISDNKITFYIDTSTANNFANITVEFDADTTDTSSRITDCTFGCLFGVGGNNDRLFLCGNPNYPNVDFHSEADDFTYFPDINTTAFGSDAVPINGYLRLNDGTLAVFKAENGKESTIYYRTGEYRYKYDTDGNVEEMNAVFPISAGNTGEGLISRYACANFGNDCLMLSKNGVYGVTLSQNVRTAERYTRERSRAINEKLKNNALSEAVGIVYQNRYYLAVDGVCYVADGRYMIADKDSLDGAYNYEWWYWDNIPAHIWINLENTLAFGTDDGKICVFDNEYSDRTIYNTSGYTVSVDKIVKPANNPANNAVPYEVLSENDKIRFSGEVYSLFLSSGEYEVSNNVISLSEEDEEERLKRFSEIYNGIKVYADSVGDSGLSVNTEYEICDVDRGNYSFKLKNGDNTVSLSVGGFNLYKKVKDKWLYVTELNSDNSEFKVKELENSEPIVLSQYKGVAVSLGYISILDCKNVVARWYSGILDLGTNESSKTLLKLTISTETSINGKISFGYRAREKTRLDNAQGVNIFSFDDMSFDNFTFETGFASSYSIPAKQRNFNFIQFRFASDNKFDCAVNSITAIYKINKHNKGVK